MSNSSSLLNVADAEEVSLNSLDIEVTEEKPFNQCLLCDYLGNGCSGPNMNVMSVDRVCEFLQIRRVQLNYTYQKVADLSMLSVITVKRILTGKIKDPSFVSLQALSLVLVADTKSKNPCALSLIPKETQQAAKDCKLAQENLAKKEIELEEERRKVEYLRERVEYIKGHLDFQGRQLEQKDKLLQDRYDFLKLKDRFIAILSILLAIALLVIIGALVIDIINSDIGFFWTALNWSANRPSFLIGI